MTPHFAYRFRLIALAVLAVFMNGLAHAEDGEFYVNTYRGIGKVSPMGVRSAAMGRAGRGLADGVNSLGVNPAALGAFQGSQFNASLGYDWLDAGSDDADQVTFKLGGAVNLDRWQKMSGPNQAVGGLLHTQHFSGAGRLDMKRSQTSVLMGYGLHLMDNLLAGASVALYDGKWSTRRGEVDANGAQAPYLDRKFIGGDFKLGAIYRLCDETTVGGSLGYSIGSFKERAAYAGNAGSGDLKRFSLGLGVAHQYAEDTLLLGDLWYERTKSDVPGVLSESNNAWGMSVGVEQRVIPDLMALRGGLYYDRTSYSGGAPIRNVVGDSSFSKGRFGVTAGVGVKLYNFDLGYSLDVNSGGDIKNLLDFSAEW